MAVSGGPRFTFDDAQWQREWRELHMDSRVKAALLLETAGVEAVSYLRSLTSDTQPPARGGGNPRRAHPGGWADVTGQLAASYFYEVRVGGRRISWSVPQAEGAEPGQQQGVEQQGGIPPTLPPGKLELVLANSAEYARALEAKDGYYVLTGVTEEAAPLRRALVATATALGFELR